MPPCLLKNRMPFGNRSGLRVNGQMRLIPPPYRSPSQNDTVLPRTAPTTAPARTGQYGNEPADINVPATINIEVPGNNRLRNANHSPKEVMNMTGKPSPNARR